MDKPTITLPHVVSEGGPIHLHAGVWAPLLKLLDRLYPQYISGSAGRVAANAYTAFHEDGRFIGCFSGITLQSIRRNPWLVEDGDQLFMRALLAGLHREGYDHHSSVCEPINYGTMALWRKLGLGARIDARGMARSAAATVESIALRDRLLDAARPDYIDTRVRVERQLAGVDPKPFIPTPAQMGVCVGTYQVRLTK